MAENVQDSEYYEEGEYLIRSVGDFNLLEQQLAELKLDPTQLEQESQTDIIETLNFYNDTLDRLERARVRVVEEHQKIEGVPVQLIEAKIGAVQQEKHQLELYLGRHMQLPEPKEKYPTTAAGYEKIEQIGRGMMNNQVWTAKCLTRDNEIVAVKLIDLATFNTQALESIKKEIQIMYWANHPNIVEFCSAFIDGSKLWLVMKLLEGSCLDIMRWCKPNGFDNEKVIATILYQVLLGIKYLHVNRKMHRDIKAANILLDSNGVALLGDFTVSAMLNEHEEKRFTFVGTPCWMAPEVVDVDKHRGYDLKADIWSLGVTAIELACGKPPHADKQPMQVVMCIVEMPAPTLENPEGKSTNEQVATAKAKWSPAFRDFVAKCCQKDPRKRPTASQLLKHKFFTQADTPEFLQKELLFDLPPPTQRFKVLEDRRKAKEMAQLKQLGQRSKSASISGGSAKINLDV